MVHAIILAYFAVLLLIGYFASRRIHDLGDYYVGGKRLGYWVAAFSARASGESAWLYLGLTGFGAAFGLQAMWIVVGETLGVAVAWFFMAERFKRATDVYGSITVPDYLVSRLARSPREALALRIVPALVLSVFVAVYVSAQIDATGKAFESFLKWDYYAGAIFGFGIVVLYTFVGGFVAVAWSDLFQGLLMLIGLTVLPLVAWSHLSGDVGMATEAGRTGLLSLFGADGLTPVGLCRLVGFAAIGLGFLGSPQVFVRFISVADTDQIKAGRWVAVVFTLLTDGGAVLAGLFGRYLLTGTLPAETPVIGEGALLGPGGEKVLPLLVSQLFAVEAVGPLLSPVIIGLFVAAVLAATMSTIDSLLVVASSAVTRDVYQQLLHPHAGRRSLTRLSRSVTLVIAVIALAIALAVGVLVPGRTIFWFVIFGFSGIAATFCPMMILCLFWKRYNTAGAVASMVTGFISIPLFKFAFAGLPTVGVYFNLIEEMAPAFALSLLAGLVVTLITSGE